MNDALFGKFADAFDRAIDKDSPIDSDEAFGPIIDILATRESIPGALLVPMVAALAGMRRKISLLEASLAAVKGFTYRGTWQPGVNYRTNDFATFRDSLWACKTDNLGVRPDQALSDGTRPWQLAAKAGKDGRDGKDSVPREAA